MDNLTQAYLNISSQLPTSKDITDRIARAYDIVDGYGYRILIEADGVYSVVKASTSMLDTNETTYLTTNKQCSCPDFEKARAGLCKHRIAIMILEEKERLDNEIKEY